MLTLPRTVRVGLAKSIFFAWLALLALPSARPAFAAEPQSACPKREAVAVAVRALLRPSHVDTAGIEAQFEVQDFGDRYAVTVKGRRRDYHDEPRDCAKRAHVAAVFVALTLAPPDIPLPEQPELPPSAASTRSSPAPSSSTAAAPAATSTPAAAAAAPGAAAAPAATTTAGATTSAAPAPAAAASGSAPAAAPAPTKAWSFQTELGALALIAPRTDSSQTALGGELRLSAVRDAWGIAAGAQVASASALELDAVSVRESRIPFDLAVRHSLCTSRLQCSLELGVVAALSRFRQEERANARTETRVEWGARAAARFALGSALSPYLSVFTQVFPFRHQLAVEPRGPIGHPSPVWLGLALGVGAKFP